MGKCFTSGNFINDTEKMRDFQILSKEDFLESYSYLTEAEYDNTMKIALQMEGIKTKLIDVLLKTITYDDMTEEQMEAVVEYETELYKPRVDALRENTNEDEIREHIHDWWLDYEIADGTEDNLLAYVGQ